jgi:Flp pilus assembly protein TadD
MANAKKKARLLISISALLLFPSSSLIASINNDIDPIPANPQTTPQEQKEVQFETTQAWRKGQDAFNEGEFLNAFLSFQEAILLSPQEANLYSNLGSCLAKLGYNNDAINAFEKALQLSPSHKTASLNLARLLTSQNLTKEAILFLTQTAKSSPDADIWKEIGFLQYSTGNLSDAISSYEQAASLEPQNPTIFYNLACLYEKNSDIEAAKNMLTKSIQLDADFFEGHYALGQLYEQSRMSTLAQESYLAAYQINPKHINLLKRLTRSFIISGEFQQARWSLNQLISLDPDSTDTKYFEAITLLNEGSNYRAIVAFEQLKPIIPNDATLWNNLAVAYNRVGDTEQAKTALSRAVALDPNQASVYTNIGVLEAKDKNWDKAKQAWEIALKLEPNKPQAAFNLSVLEEIPGQKSNDNAKE